MNFKELPELKGYSYDGGRLIINSQRKVTDYSLEAMHNNRRTIVTFNKTVAHNGGSPVFQNLATLTLKRLRKDECIAILSCPNDSLSDLKTFVLCKRSKEERRILKAWCADMKNESVTPILSWPQSGCEFGVIGE